MITKTTINKIIPTTARIIFPVLIYLITPGSYLTRKFIINFIYLIEMSDTFDTAYLQSFSRSNISALDNVVSKVKTRQTLYIVGLFFFILSIVGLLINNKLLWGISLILFTISIVITSI
jgi:hypothetical protein